MNAEISDLKNRDTNTDEEEQQKLEQQLEKFFAEKEITKGDQTCFYVNNEEAMCYSDSRSQLMTLMLRSRNMIGRLFRKQGLLLNSYYALKQALVNFKSSAEGWSNDVETGMESKDKGSFELPEMFGGSNAGAPAAKGGKAAPAAPAKGKAPAGKGADPA